MACPNPVAISGSRVSSASSFPDQTMIDLLNASEDLRWVWVWLEIYNQLSPDLQIEAWDRLYHDLDIPEIHRATFFWAVWTTNRYWDNDKSLAYRLLTVFNLIEQDALAGGDDAAQRIVRGIRFACPHIVELDHSMMNWTEYKLPVERT
jgi:hypothetical protein